MSASIKTMFKRGKTLAGRMAGPKTTALPPAMPRMCRTTSGRKGSCPGCPPWGPFQSLKRYVVFSIKQSIRHALLNIKVNVSKTTVSVLVWLCGRRAVFAISPTLVCLPGILQDETFSKQACRWLAAGGPGPLPESCLTGDFPTPADSAPQHRRPHRTWPSSRTDPHPGVKLMNTQLIRTCRRVPLFGPSTLS